MAKNKETTETVVKKKKEAPKKTGKHGAPLKPSIFARIKDYFIGVVAEMKRVVWPTRKEVVNSTIIVLVTLIFFGIFTFAIDWLSTGGIELLLDLAKKVQ
jgi:preprotein translocase subunit SecE